MTGFFKPSLGTTVPTKAPYIFDIWDPNPPENVPPQPQEEVPPQPNRPIPRRMMINPNPTHNRHQTSHPPNSVPPPRLPRYESNPVGDEASASTPNYICGAPEQV
jgi:hypothetical protein